MASKLVFNEEKHVYMIGDRYLPGVSSILKKAGLVDLSGIPEEVLERARNFGTAVHKACELEDLGTLDVASLSEHVVPHLEAWRKFKTDAKVEVEEIEMPVFSQRWWVAGKLDRIIVMDGKRCLVDLKSSSTIYPSMKIQLAAYKLLFEEMTGVKISGRLIVQLLKDGSYKLTPCNDETDEQVFLAAVQIYKFTRKEKAYYDRDRNNFN